MSLVREKSSISKCVTFQMCNIPFQLHMMMRITVHSTPHKHVFNKKFLHSEIIQDFYKNFFQFLFFHEFVFILYLTATEAKKITKPLAVFTTKFKISRNPKSYLLELQDTTNCPVKKSLSRCRLCFTSPKDLTKLKNWKYCRRMAF